MTREIKPNFAMMKYTDFLHAIAMGNDNMDNVLSTIATLDEKTKIAARTICAMTPCMRLYAFIGQKLEFVLQNDANNHTYKNWIYNYSAASFEVYMQFSLYLYNFVTYYSFIGCTFLL